MFFLVYIFIVKLVRKKKKKRRRRKERLNREAGLEFLFFCGTGQSYFSESLRLKVIFGLFMIYNVK